MRITLLLFTLGLYLTAHAAFTFAGVVGNSGGEGPTVIRGAVARMSGGVAVDARGRVFTGGGDRILCLSRRGNLLWETRLPKPEWVLGGPTFAIAGRYLYFIAGKPVRYEGNYNYLWTPFTLVEPNLCRVDMILGAVPTVLAAPAAFGWLAPWWNGEVTVAAAPGGDTAYIGYTTASVTQGNYARDGYAVARVNADGTLMPLFHVPQSWGHMSVDEAGNFYLGGGGTVRKYDPAGQPVPGFTPTPLPSLGAVASGYSGAVMLTRDALWDMGHYGFVGRFTREMKPAPGALVQWEHALSFVAQIADAPDGDFYVKSDEALYVAAVVDDRLVLKKRFGSLPRVQCLVLTPAGYIGLGNDARLLWFDFADDACAAAPEKAEIPGPIAQGLPDGEVGLTTLAVNPGYAPQEYIPTPHGISLLSYAAEPPRSGSSRVQTLGTGEYNGRLTAIAHVGAWYFALDGDTHRVLRATAKEPCAFAPLADGPTSSTLAVLANRYLLCAAGGTLTAYRVADDGTLTPAWTLPGFGDELYAAVSGNNLLLADTKHHRVLLYTVADHPETAPTPQAQYGETDHPGDDFAHLNAPTLVSLSGARAVVYDSGNQRVVKLRME